ncbi:hypothetical protein [Photobacterium halotolerans]|uniref:Uncharacterized protein n=1 Tax=Photobacterium halotolerans TaxID=265726 RepID=A0A0F5VIQ2_9GAMM|nr:hypothetical protein [Photobacterium halotolerans]KKD01375.1 hypothetical protein KY46_00645 [Photobacterium halotolerans]
MTIKIENIVAIGNGGDGVRVEGDVDLDIGGIRAERNGGQGVNIIKHASIMDRFGLPRDTDPKELAALLVKIQAGQTQQEKEAVVKRSSLWGKFKVGALSSTTLMANLIAISTNPQVTEIIKKLLS